MEYDGKQVEVVPRIPIEVIDRINNAVKKEKAQIVVTEIGGNRRRIRKPAFFRSNKITEIKTS